MAKKVTVIPYAKLIYIWIARGEPSYNLSSQSVIGVGARVDWKILDVFSFLWSTVELVWG